MNEKTISSGAGLILLMLSLFLTVYSTAISGTSPITSALMANSSLILDVLIVILLLYLVSTIEKSANYKLNIIILLILLLILEVYFRNIPWLAILINITNFILRGYLILEFVQYEWKPSKDLDIVKLFDKVSKKKDEPKRKEEPKKEEPKKEEPKKEEPKKDEESMSEKNRQKFRDMINKIGKDNLTKSSREDGFEIIDKYKKTDELTMDRVKEAVSKLRYSDGSEVKWSEVS
jgi:hypothetical protein